MRAKLKAPAEYKTFSDALRQVLSVSHSEMKSMLDAEKASKKRKSKRASSSRASGVSAKED